MPRDSVTRSTSILGGVLGSPLLASLTSARHGHFEPLSGLLRSTTAQTAEPPPTRGRGRARTGLKTAQVSTSRTGTCGKKMATHCPLRRSESQGTAGEQNGQPVRSQSAAKTLRRARRPGSSDGTAACRKVRYVPSRPGAVGRAVTAFPQSTVGTSSLPYRRARPDGQLRRHAPCGVGFLDRAEGPSSVQGRGLGPGATALPQPEAEGRSLLSRFGGCATPTSARAGIYPVTSAYYRLGLSTERSAAGRPGLRAPVTQARPSAGVHGRSTIYRCDPERGRSHDRSRV